MKIALSTLAIATQWLCLSPGLSCNLYLLYYCQVDHITIRARAEQAIKVWGAKYVTWTYLYEEKLQSYGVIVKVGGAIAPSSPLVQPPLQSVDENLMQLNCIKLKGSYTLIEQSP